MVFLWHSLFFSLIPLFFFTVFVFKWLFNTKTQRNLPPSPPKLPIIGNIHQLGPLPHQSFHSLAQQYGPLMLLHLGSVPVLVLSSADAAREILKTNDIIFSNRPRSSIAGRLMYNYKDVAFAPYGEYWRQIRSICVLQLLSSHRVQSFRAMREEETTLMIEKIKRSSSSSSLVQPVVNLSELFISLTNDVVCRVALGRKYSGGGRTFKELLGDALELLGVLNVGDYIPWLGWLNRVNGLDAKVERVAKELDQFFEGVIEEHMDRHEKESGEDKGQMDFVDVLLEIQRNNMEVSPLQRDSIKSIIMDMFGAGTDTTYTALEWAMAELLRHPNIMKELQNEVRGIARGKLNITEDDLMKMPYLKVVIKETLRLHPPLPLLVPRESTQDVKVLGYDIAAGTQVIINAWTIGRDPLLWEEAEEFLPERFLNTSIDFKGHDFQLIPFGAGRRGCPGTQFAMTIDELALANLVNNFDFTLPGGARAEDLDMTGSPGLTLHKKSPLLVIATPCSSC
uniref:Uncharacterized protein n=1 Tax=Davidia involucrata TaxID=16924 RepID=A0A5B7AB44_DAVIN